MCSRGGQHRGDGVSDWGRMDSSTPLVRNQVRWQGHTSRKSWRWWSVWNKRDADFGSGRGKASRYRMEPGRWAECSQLHSLGEARRNKGRGDGTGLVNGRPSQWLEWPRIVLGTQGIYLKPWAHEYGNARPGCPSLNGLLHRDTKTWGDQDSRGPPCRQWPKAPMNQDSEDTKQSRSGWQEAWSSLSGDNARRLLAECSTARHSDCAGAEAVEDMLWSVEGDGSLVGKMKGKCGMTNSARGVGTWMRKRAVEFGTRVVSEIAQATGGWKGCYVRYTLEGDSDGLVRYAD